MSMVSPETCGNNVVEENQESLDAGSHRIKAPVKAFGITTVRLRD